MQQQGGQYGHMAPATSLPPATTQMMGGTAVDNQIVEEASPISSRPPAGNLDELMHAEEEAGDRGGAGGVGSASGNRWPKQETLALLKIRSEMDAVFRDAPLKGPLWEDVSRKLAELGYKRSAKKCKEKFENVHKYYKRTKEGRAGRQDGKSYKFFSELEALHTNTSTVATTNVSSSLAMAAPHVSTNPSASSTNFVPLGFGISTAAPMPLSSVHTTTITFTPQTQQLPSSNNIGTSTTMIPPSMTATAPTQGPPTQAAAAGGVSFSSNSTSSSHGTEDDNGGDEEGGEEMEERSNYRKRKRASMSKGGGGSTSSNGGGSGSRSMMEFFENLMRQVMQKQESMQQRFLEAIEKGEQDRMIREEAWKRQEMARLTREREIMAQERAIAAQRDAAIISFVQKITGQAIQLPRHASAMPSAPAAPPPPQPAPVPTPTPTVVQDAPLAQPHHQHRQQQPQQQQVAPQQMQHQSRPSTEVVRQTSSKSTDVVMAVPEQQVPPQEASGGGGSFEQSPSRWPKAEVLALINIRSGLEYRYQEAVPKGPLWEEVSAGMARLGYNRNAKRCKEKWENINKYYKKMKESNKKRPEDAKTCPYFHQLDALYRQKLLGNTSGGGGSSSTSGLGNENRPQQHLQDRSDIPMLAAQPSQAAEPENKNGSSDNNNNQASNVNLPGSLFGEETGGAAQKPEDIVKELMDQPQNHQHLTVDDYDKVDEPDHSDNLDQDEYEDDDQEDNEELQEQRKMAYKIEFQRQSNAGPPNGGNGKPSFLAMVQ